MSSESLDHTSEEDLRQAYREADGNISVASERFDVTYQTVWQRLTDLGIHCPDSHTMAGDEEDVQEDVEDEMSESIDRDDEELPDAIDWSSWEDLPDVKNVQVRNPDDVATVVNALTAARNENPTIGSDTEAMVEVAEAYTGWSA